MASVVSRILGGKAWSPTRVRGRRGYIMRHEPINWTSAEYINCGQTPTDQLVGVGYAQANLVHSLSVSPCLSVSSLSHRQM
jgi:hypothetical protein